MLDPQAGTWFSALIACGFLYTKKSPANFRDLCFYIFFFKLKSVPTAKPNATPRAILAAAKARTGLTGNFVLMVNGPPNMSCAGLLWSFILASLYKKNSSPDSFESFGTAQILSLQPFQCR